MRKPAKVDMLRSSWDNREVRILVTGASGTLGSALCQILQEKHEVIRLKRADLDLSRTGEIIPVITSLVPEIIIHTAAMTDVDACEENPEEAYAVNWLGTLFLARAASTIGAIFLYISTDYVFDGEKGNYMEHDPTNPIQAYGRSKLFGEIAVRENAEKHYIIRTSWVYGPGGRNFLSRLPAFPAGSELKVVADQVNRPTYSLDLADMIGRFIALNPPWGIYHITGSGETTPHGFSTAVNELFGRGFELTPVPGDQFKRPARRPRNTTLSNFALERGLGLKMPDWRDGLRRYAEWWKKSGKS